MPVTDAELLLKLSTGSAAGSGNAAASTPAQSLGGQVSTTALTNNSLHNLFDAITGDENVALDDEYRLLFIHNSNATLAAGPNGKLWIFTDAPAGAADIFVALDATGPTALAAATAQSEAIANEDTIPTGEVFSAPLTKAAGIALVNLPAASVYPIWIKRLANNGGARSSVSVQLRAEWDVL